MGVLAYADENLTEKLKSFADSESFSIGLVIAQKANEQIYVTHLAPLPSPVDAEDVSDNEETKEKQLPTKPTSILTVVEGLVATQARQVVRMLPGGLDVLGVYIISPLSELANSATQGKLRIILTAVHKATSIYYLGTSESPLEKIVLFGCTESSRIGVKSIDLSEQGTSLVTGTLKTQETKWTQLNYNYLLSCPIYFPKDKSSQPLSKMVLTSFRPWAQSLKDTLILIEGKVCDEEEELNSTEGKPSKKKGNKDVEGDTVINVSEVQILENQNPSGASNISEFEECCGLILFKGTVAGRAFLNGKATASEGFEAVRNDLIRSLVSRWEMHCDSLVEEPQVSSDDSIFHEPPRRVFLKGGSSPLSLCDYLFPGDSVSDACQSAKELLGITIEDQDVDDSVEKWADPLEFRVPETLSSYGEEKLFEEISSVKQSNAFQFFVAIMVGVLAMALSYYVMTSRR